MKISHILISFIAGMINANLPRQSVFCLYYFDAREIFILCYVKRDQIRAGTFAWRE